MVAEIATDEDLSKAGFELYYFWVVPHVGPEDRGKYAAVDIDSPHYEVDSDPEVARNRLKARCPGARIWIERIGDPEDARRDYYRRLDAAALLRPKRKPEDDWSAKGQTLYRAEILPSLKPEDENKYVAIDIDTGQYEVDKKSLEAGLRLRARCPAARIWMERVGHPEATRMPYRWRISEV